VFRAAAMLAGERRIFACRNSTLLEQTGHGNARIIVTAHQPAPFRAITSAC